MRDDVVSFVETMAAKTERTIKSLLQMIGITPGKYHDWKGRKEQSNRHNADVPKSHWLLPWERELIVEYARENRDLGYRLLSYEMLDLGLVAVSPSTFYRVLKEEGALGSWNRTKSSTRGDGFEQPSYAHQHWHVDIKYVKFQGTFLFLISVIDGWSRYIVNHEVRQSMETLDVEITIQRAFEKFADAKPRIISDNGSQFLSKEFASFLRQSEVAHVRTSVNYPQSNGKIERYHRTLSEECLRKTSLIDLEDARTQIGEFVEKYNRERKHSALHYLTPEDFLEGRVEAKLKLREKRIREAQEERKNSRNQTTDFTLLKN